MYIGNDLQVAESGNKIIDDISSSFNGSTTSFALLVGGAAPVPFPINTQQIYISVNGVIQEPDPTGSAGFKLLGNNIVFSSAPANGHAFFGVILSGADYVTVGTEFPAGSATAPSITFGNDNNTGLYSVTGGTMGFTSDGVQTFTLDGNGFTLPDNKKLLIGASSDFQIWHDATNNVLRGITGQTWLQSDALYLSSTTGQEQYLSAVLNGAVTLMYDSSTKFATTTTGTDTTGVHVDDGATHDGDVTFTGAAANLTWDKSEDDLIFADNAKAVFGTSSDLQIYHQGTYSIISNQTGVLYIEAKAGETGIALNPDGAVDLRYDGSQRVITNSNGAEIKGATDTTLIVEGGTNGYAQLYLNASGSASVNYLQSDQHLIFWINAAERMRMDTSGRLIIGATSTNSVGGFGGAALQIEGLNAATSAMSLIRHSNDAVGSTILMGKTRGTADGATTVVQDDDVVARIIAYGGDGTDTESSLGAIQFDVDGTPGSNDMPGRIVFSTTADGAASYTERMRLTSTGSLRIGNTTYTANSGADNLVVGTGQDADGWQGITIYSHSNDGGALYFADGAGSAQYAGYVQYNHSSNALEFGTNGAGVARIKSDGDFIIGNSNDSGYAGYADTLTLVATGHGGMTIRNGTSSQGAIYFSDATGTGTGTYEGIIGYDHASNNMTFATSHSTRMTIDANGQVCIGHTPTDWDSSNWDTLALSSNRATIAAYTPSGYPSLFLSNNSHSEGNGWGTTWKQTIQSATTTYAPCRYYQYAGTHYFENSATRNDDNDISWTQLMHLQSDGDVNVKTGDLLFGTADKGVVLGATTNVAANTLADYEEGSFTPAWYTDNGAPSFSYSTQSGTYVKVGKIVHCNIIIQSTISGTETGNLKISGWPFTAAAGAVNHWQLNTTDYGNWDSYPDGTFGGYFQYSATWLALMQSGEHASQGVHSSMMGTNSYLYGSITYQTT